MRQLSYIVSEQEAGMTAGHFLKRRGFSEKVLAALRRDPESLQISGKAVFTNHKLEAGDNLVVFLKEFPASKQIPPVKPLVLPVILFEDEDLLVVDKPAGMPVHVSMGHYEDTLGNALAWRQQENFPQEARGTLHIINRLDRDTSGLVIVAKHRLAAGILSEMARRGEIHAIYLALCRGKTPEAGMVNAPIARETDSVITRCVRADGQHAVTHYKTLRYDEAEDMSLTEVTLETGRTHQIRVHMKHIGHPLLGDFLYNPGDCTMPHQALHRSRLAFTHPITGEALCFQAFLPGEYPEAIRRWVKAWMEEGKELLKAATPPAKKQ